ncbi:MAG: TolC family protein [Flavipsychrobacter sp.]
MRLLQLHIILLMCLLSARAMAQDGTLYLSKDDVLSIVKAYHPVIKQANLKVDRSKAEVMSARGSFDPYLKTNAKQKTFDGKLYYNYFNPELKLPTWYGIEFKAGAEEVYGSRVFNELTPGKSVYAGVKVSVLQGLLFDERRATLRKAQAIQEMTEAEQRLVVNNILFEAVATYWNWVREYQTYLIYKEVVQISTARLNFVRLEYEQGNRPAIDTVEAWTQIQSYELLKNEALMNYYNAGFELSTYLWLEDRSMMSWSDNIEPDSTAQNISSVEVDGLETFLAQALANHPKLQMVDAKLDALKIEKRLKGQSLLPTLDINANLLNKGYEVPNELTTPFIENNYKFGVDFSVPLFLRKGRGGYRSAKIKLQETAFEQDYTSANIENKIRSYYNEVIILKNQIELYTEAYNNFNKMYRGELTRYNVGESTLFLVNSRENKMLQAQQKLIALKTKWSKSYAGLLWAAAYL